MKFTLKVTFVFCTFVSLNDVFRASNALVVGNQSTGYDNNKGSALLQRPQSRGQFLRNIAATMLSLSTTILLQESASAAAPITARETDSLAAMAKRAFHPKPPKILRRKLSQDFAVLLMRSSYNALDQLDCVPMDQFQRDFFLIRRAEYEPYTMALGPGMVQQGDLTDPYYFDFISFAQYETINREISQSPPLVFEEQQPVDQGEDKALKFVSVVVKRDPRLTNHMLGPEHSRMVGAAILDRLDEIFGETDSAIPKIKKGSKPDALFAALKQLLNLFLVNGYAFGGLVSMVPVENDSISFNSRGAKFLISLSAPATLWGGKILQSERAVLSNDFFVKTATELIARAGYICSSSIKYNGTNEDISILIL